MRSRYQINDPQGVHFVTSTVVNWLPVFTTAQRCDILIDSLRFCREKKDLKIYAWVILDNHLHEIVQAPDLTQVMIDFKRHTARRMIEQLQFEKCDWLINQLSYLRAKHKVESTHQFWQKGFHPQSLRGDAMIEQKRTYIHNNPVRRGLVVAPEHWRYSSAHDRLTAAVPVLRCDDWN